MPKTSQKLIAGAATLALCAGSTCATWSIIIVNTRTKEVGVASATCLTNFDLRNNTPVLLSGIGAATAQSFVDSTGLNRVLIRDRLIQGASPQSMLAELGSGFDPGHQTRQYGIVDTTGRAATFSGTGAGAWAGGQTGQVGEWVYAVQGNVLTGEPVVTMAVEALLNTSGDMPAKLMAAMEAARLMGGDGRCSCNEGAPTTCGAPPPTFAKSSHIAYLMISRLGDLDTSTGIYDTAGARSLAIIPRNGLAPGLVTGTQIPDTMTTLFPLPSRSLCSLTLPAFEPQTNSFGVVDGAARVAAADVNGDGISDLVALGQLRGTLTVLPGVGGDQLGPPVSFDIASSQNPVGLEIGDLNSDGMPEVVISYRTPSRIAVLENLVVDAGGAPLFAAPIDVAVPTLTGFGVRLLNLNGDGLVDIVSTRFGEGVASLINLGNLNFSSGPTYAGVGTTSGLDIADFDSDGLDDVVLAASSGTITRVIRTTMTGFTLMQDVVGFVTPRAVRAGLIDGDSRPDIFMAGPSRIQTATNTGSGFGSVRAYVYTDGTVSANFNSAVLADFDLDGDLDAAMLSDSASVFVAHNLGRMGQPTPPSGLVGRFTDRVGTAAGDYFLNLNVANQSTNAVDAVFQLQSQFNTWRNQTEAAPDAVNSIVSFSPRCVSSLGGETATLTIDLKKANGTFATSPVRVELACATPGVTIGAVNAIGNGRYTLSVSVAASPVPSPRNVKFRVITNEAARPVVLMPMPELHIGHRADVNTDGVVDLSDYLDFVAAFAIQAPESDFNADGIIDFFDYLDFVAVFSDGGC